MAIIHSDIFEFISFLDLLLLTSYMVVDCLFHLLTYNKNCKSYWNSFPLPLYAFSVCVCVCFVCACVCVCQRKIWMDDVRKTWKGKNMTWPGLTRDQKQRGLEEGVLSEPHLSSLMKEQEEEECVYVCLSVCLSLSLSKNIIDYVSSFHCSSCLCSY